MRRFVAWAVSVFLLVLGIDLALGIASCAGALASRAGSKPAV